MRNAGYFKGPANSTRPQYPEGAGGHTGKQVVTDDNMHIDKKGTQADLSELVAQY